MSPTLKSLEIDKLSLTERTSPGPGDLGQHCSRSRERPSDRGAASGSRAPLGSTPSESRFSYFFGARVEAETLARLRQ